MHPALVLMIDSKNTSMQGGGWGGGGFRERMWKERGEGEEMKEGDGLK